MRLRSITENADNSHYSLYADNPDIENPYGLDLTEIRKLRVPNDAFLTSWGTIAKMYGQWEIDASIAEFIKRLNDSGYTTDQSDSGMYCDHPLLASNGEHPVGPYVYFQLAQLTDEQIRIIRSVTKEVTIGKSYGVPCLQVRLGTPGDDKQVLRNWKDFTDKLCDYVQ